VNPHDALLLLGFIGIGVFALWRSLPTLLRMNCRADQRAARAGKGE